MYAETTSCRFPIYADPTRKLYDQLGMSRTLELGPYRPDYIQTSLISNVMRSIYQGVMSGRGAVRGGDYKQVGGEFLFEDSKVTWCHRMRNTRDHAEIPVLRKILGLDAERPHIRKRWSANLGRATSDRSQSWSRSRSRTRNDSD